MRNSTLLFLIKKDHQNNIHQLCLAMKKRGFGMGRWNGSGGKVQEGEKLEQAAVREVSEELNVIPHQLQQVAELVFIFPHQSDWDQVVAVYFSEQWDDEPSESEEMKPLWFRVKDIPYEEMWADDILWLPKVLAGEYVRAKFVFGTNDNVVSYEFN